MVEQGNIKESQNEGKVESRGKNENTLIKSFSHSLPQNQRAKERDVAFDYGTNKFVWTTANGDMTHMGKYLILWKKINGNWFVSTISFTIDAPTPVTK